MEIDLRADVPLDAPPQDVPLATLVVLCLDVWQRVLAEDPKRALNLLDALPSKVASSPRIEEARAHTRSLLSPVDVLATPGERRSLSVLIWTGPAWEVWSPGQADETGLGGSETAAVRMAEELALLGHRVTVASECAGHEGNLRGVRYLRQDDLWDSPEALGLVDVLVVSRQAWALPRFKARAKVLWVHDVHVGEDNPKLRSEVEHADLVFALSDWHASFLSQAYPWLDRRKISLTRNAVDASRFLTLDWDAKKNHVVYASSPDRGLGRLLELWPRILGVVPSAELHVCYGFNTWEKMIEKNGGVGREQVEELKVALRRSPRTVLHGRVGQRELAHVFMTAKVWGYPTHFHETSCITAREAMIAGCVPVTTKLAALEQTVHHGILIDPPPSTEAYGDAFVRSVIRVLHDDDRSIDARRMAEKAREKEIALGGWSTVARQWDVVFHDLLAKKEEASVGIIEVSQRPEVGKSLRVAITLGRLGASVHGTMNVREMTDGTAKFATGTMAGFFTLCRSLAERGHTVDAFADLDRSVTSYGLSAVNFYGLDDASPDDTYDCYVSINEPDVLRSAPKNKLRLVAMWLNDFSFCQPGWDEHVDCYVTPSKTLARYLVSNSGTDPKKIAVIPIGVNLERFGPSRKKPGSMVWCSSPDRGLHHVLEMFPEVRRRVPGATLSVYYRLDPWISEALARPVRTSDDAAMRDRAAAASHYLSHGGRDGQCGVTVYGPSPPATVARALNEAVLFPYPCDPMRFTEGFSLATAEACAAGCVPVLSDADALPEIYGSVAVVIPGRPGERRSEWLDAMTEALTNEELARERSDKARKLAAKFSSEKMAEDWERLIMTKIALR